MPGIINRRNLKRALVYLISAVLLLVVAGIATVLVAGWRAFFPDDISTEQRLSLFPADNLPLTSNVRVYWNDHQVPFIDGDRDDDVAFVLGMVHAHLRGAQIEIFKRVAQARLAEMGGPPAAAIDEALRIMDGDWSQDSLYDALDDHTRVWLERFAQGINFYRQQNPTPAPEMPLLGLEYEPFTARDILSIGRLAATDVNWIAYFILLSSRDSEHWPDIWEKSLQAGMSGPVSFDSGQKLDDLEQLLMNTSRSGSNSIAVTAQKSASGNAMIANDPHLGLSVPNFWVLAGYRSPSYHCVGMMVAGLPFIALGRNPDLAWGGTNMRSASSDLYDVTDLSADQITETIDTIRVRFGTDEEITIRRTPYGPIISDAEIVPSPHGRDIALRWVGHQKADDLGAFLRANRAGNLREFVEAFRGYAVSGQNMLAVDTVGNIAMTLAVRLPRRHYNRPDRLLLDPDNTDHQWCEFLEAPDLPVAVNPPCGFIVSSNNRPTDYEVPIGYFFSGEERIERLKQLLTTSDKVSFDDLKKIQRDTYSAAADSLAATWLQLIHRHSLDTVASSLVRALQEWDGMYDQSALGPVAFEMLTYHIVQQYFQLKGGAPFYSTWNYLTSFLAEDITALPDSSQSSLLAASLSAAAVDFDRFDSWGDMHRQRAAHPLGNVPLLGSFFVWDEFPVGGSRETVMKTNHELDNERSSTTYGSQSRHISVMDDPDNNYFVLFGGQDGWIGSANLIDQLELWKSSQYIKFPLRPATVRATFEYHMLLSPAGPDPKPDGG